MSEKDYEAADAFRAMSPPMPCTYCGKEMVVGTERHPTRDHIWPKRLRSIDAGRIGTVWCCAACNLEKGDMSPSEWRCRIERAKP